jgi:hypothetical protein
MVAASIDTDHAMAQTLAEFLRDQDIVQGLWMHHVPERTEFWLLTHPTDPEYVRPLFEANLILDERYPRGRYSFIVVNPANFDVPDFSFQPPFGAEEIDLHRP